jgi:hypothetical protein
MHCPSVCSLFGNAVGTSIKTEERFVDGAMQIGAGTRGCQARTAFPGVFYGLGNGCHQYSAVRRLLSLAVFERIDQRVAHTLGERVVKPAIVFGCDEKDILGSL